MQVEAALFGMPGGYESTEYKPFENSMNMP